MNDIIIAIEIEILDLLKKYGIPSRGAEGIRGLIGYAVFQNDKNLNGRIHISNAGITVDPFCLDTFVVELDDPECFNIIIHKILEDFFQDYPELQNTDPMEHTRYIEYAVLRDIFSYLQESGIPVMNCDSTHALRFGEAYIGSIEIEDDVIHISSINDPSISDEHIEMTDPQAFDKLYNSIAIRTTT